MLLNRPVTAFMLVLATFIFGTIGLRDLSVDLLPDVDVPTLMVQTDWTGASAREIESRINEPLEGMLSTVPGVQGIQSFARPGQGLIAVSFEWGYDMNLAFLNAREKLDRVRSALPELASRPQLLHTNPSDEPIAILGITARGQPEPDFATRLDLKRWADQVLTRRLEQIEGVAQALMVGAIVPEVHIRIDPQMVDRYGLSIESIRRSISDANIFSPAGELRDGWYRYSVNIQSRIRSLDDIRNVPLGRTGGEKVLRLSDVAMVELGEQDPVSFSMLDGSEILTVLVKKDYDTNTVSVFETLKPVLESLAAEYPGIEVQVLNESATYISNTISNLLQTLLLGGILAFMVLFLFLNDVRMPFTLGIVIPVSIFLTFFVMYLFGIQLNIVSLSGLTLGIGLLLDNAIVVLENINRYRQEKRPLLEAAAMGTKEIALAITASTLTTISVFLPLIFLGGFEGAFFRDQAFTLSISLLASLLVALGVLPVLVVQIQRRHEKDAGTDNRFTAGFNYVLELYEAALQRVLKRPVWLFGGVLLGGILAGYAFMQLPKSMLPDTRVTSLSYRVTLPGNAALVTTRQSAMDLTNRVRAVDGVSGILSMGGYTDQTTLARIAREGLNKFTLLIPVADAEAARKTEAAIAGFVDAQPGWNLEPLATNNVFTTLLGESASPVVLQFVGIDRIFSERAAETLDAFLTEQGSQLTLRKQYPERINTYEVRVRTDQLLRYGLSDRDVISFLESLARGNRVTEWTREDESIALRIFSSDRSTFDPASVSINAGGRTIPIQQIAIIEPADEPAQLERVDQTPVLSYITGLSLADWWWKGKRIRDQVREFSRQTGQQVLISGSALQVDELLRDMGRLLSISLLLIYLILAIQYENLKYPLIILFSVPFAWIGSLVLLWLAGSGLNVLSFMGILILTGIAVNDAILKVDFMRRYLEETGDLDQAVILAGKHRFRPVVMTTLTTCLGLVPMILPLGDGYEFRQALGLALMGGMISSTVLTLFVIPTVFRMTNPKKLRAEN